MSVLVVGLSHKSAPVTLLERASVAGDALGKLLHDAASSQYAASAFVVSTCNRVEVYAEVEKFHGGVSAITELLARHTGIDIGLLTQHLYVHYEERAVQHLFAVACGLDSMVIGEGQILGQVRQALKYAEDQGTLGRPLVDLGRLALRAGKRAHSETGIDQAGASIVSVGVDLAAGLLHPPGQTGHTATLDGVPTLVVGAGSMSALAAATAALAARQAASSFRPLVFVDLALPRDVDPAVANLPGVAVIGLADIGAASRVGALAGYGTAAYDQDIASVRRIVAEEVAAHASATLAARVTPTVVALRAKAAGVVESELTRLAGRLAGASDHDLGEIEKAMRRVVDKLLHAPTVRVKELAGSPGGDSYAAALRELFDLDPKAVEAVTRADADLASEPGGGAQ